LGPGMEGADDVPHREASDSQWWPPSAPATIDGELRQVRKEATATVDSGDGESWRRPPPFRVRTIGSADPAAGKSPGARPRHGSRISGGPDGPGYKPVDAQGA